MNIYIYLFLLFGTVFGLSTFSHKHLFSEGPHKADTPQDAPTVGSRLLWAMVCTFLWPIMLISGLNSAVILAKRRRAAVAENH